jgi:hypothetical protein
VDYLSFIEIFACFLRDAPSHKIYNLTMALLVKIGGNRSIYGIVIQQVNNNNNKRRRKFPKL